MSTPAIKAVGETDPPMIFDVIDFDDFWDSLSPVIHEMRSHAALEPRDTDRFILEAVRKLAEACYLMPASAKHHDAQPGGLVRHTLQVALASLRRVPAYGADRVDYRDRIATMVFAILHDLGRAWDMNIYDVASGVRYHPETMDMTKWVRTHAVTKIRVEWLNRAYAGSLCSEPLGVLFSTYFFSAGLVTIIGRRRSVSLIHAATRSVGRPRYDYYANVKAADIECAMLQNPHGMGLDEAFLPALAAAIVENAHDPKNQHCWVGPTHTVCALFDGAGHGLTWEMAVHVVSEHPGMVGASSVVDRLAEIRPTAFAMYKRLKECNVMRHVVAVSVNGSVPVAAVVIDNRYLWRQLAPQALRHISAPPMFFGDPHEPTKDVYSAESVGFSQGRAYLGDLEPSALAVARASHGAGPIDLVEAVRQDPIVQAKIRKRSEGGGMRLLELSDADRAVPMGREFSVELMQIVLSFAPQLEIPDELSRLMTVRPGEDMKETRQAIHDTLRYMRRVLLLLRDGKFRDDPAVPVQEAEAA
jgi:hypothetical protein